MFIGDESPVGPARSRCANGGDAARRKSGPRMRPMPIGDDASEVFVYICNEDPDPMHDAGQHTTDQEIRIDDNEDVAAVAQRSNQCASDTAHAARSADNNDLYATWGLLTMTGSLQDNSAPLVEERLAQPMKTGITDAVYDGKHPRRRAVSGVGHQTRPKSSAASFLPSATACQYSGPACA